MDDRTESAVVGGGCFWCLEAYFKDLAGIRSVQSGYAGGHTPNPTYEQVCAGTTGHAEVVKLDYDPNVVSYEDILRVFFTMHDPTTQDRQGNDVGTQYRSIVLYENEEQRKRAEAVMKEVTERELYPDPLVTQLEPLSEFHPAEAYHADYFARNPTQPYCAVVIAPKVAQFRRLYADRLASKTA